MTPPEVETVAPPETAPNPANMLGLDYRALADTFAYGGPVLDIHTHVATPHAAEVFFDAATTYGVTTAYTMCGLGHARELHPRFGDRLKFITVPDFRAFMTGDRDLSVFTTRWLDDLRAFREELGSVMFKLWAAPRGIDIPDEATAESRDAALNDPTVGHPLKLDSPIRRRGIELALDLGYRVMMTHVGDPDTWFKTKYADASRYGTKPQQYEPLERILTDYPQLTVIGAHMGGWPEDLDWLQSFLDRHPNYVVDTSACKWQVRELSKHPRKLAEFVRSNPDRVLFGTDIVAHANNAVATGPDTGQGFGFDLYASRYWATRTLLEGGYDGPSPIADPDLPMLDPSLPKLSTAQLRGADLAAVTPDLLTKLYHDNAAAIVPAS